MRNYKSIVVSANPDKYEIGDSRLRKPILHKKISDKRVVGSALMQELDEIKIKNKAFLYFQPNNIALLLSIAQNSLERAQTFFKKNFKNKDEELNVEKHNGDKKKFLEKLSTNICDYIELIETSIVFSYTAIEAFSNISIPDDYKYEYKKNQKSKSEIYSKAEIERRISLKDKVSKILPKIYNVKRQLKKSGGQIIQN